MLGLVQILLVILLVLKIQRISRIWWKSTLLIHSVLYSRKLISSKKDGVMILIKNLEIWFTRELFSMKWRVFINLQKISSKKVLQSMLLKILFTTTTTVVILRVLPILVIKKLKIFIINSTTPQIQRFSHMVTLTSLKILSTLMITTLKISPSLLTLIVLLSLLEEYNKEKNIQLRDLKIQLLLIRINKSKWVFLSFVMIWLKIKLKEMPWVF